MGSEMCIRDRGSLFYEYRENDTRLTGRRIDRDFGINLNVAIRG